MSRNQEDLEKSPHNLLNNGNRGHQGPMQPRVAIIGAGVAGLRCAEVLIKSGLNVTMYEGRNRIGGRVGQMKSAGRWVDLGANWLHGDTPGNPISRIANKTETVLHGWEERHALFNSAGERINDDKAAAMSEAVWETIAKGFKYSDKHSHEINPWKSLMDYFKEEIPKDEHNPDTVSDILKVAQGWGPFVGDPIERQSLKFFFLEETIDGENVFVASTYKDILEEIGRTAIERADLHLNQDVVKFEECTRSSISGRRSTTVHTASGIEREFDEVVVTAPLGWLKRHKNSAFQNPLPERLSQAMDNISYGRLEKIYITFPKAFWHGSANPVYPSFTQFLSPDYVDHPKDITWNQNCISLADLPGGTAHPTLLFYVYGPCATEMVKMITDTQPESQAYYDKLDAFLLPFYARLPNYSTQSEDCKPIAFLATQWQNDKFAGNGSYTNYQVGLKAGDEDIEIMRAGLPERGLWFAGEHTAPFIALGTTTGAYWSGEGVARRICELYNIPYPAEEASEAPEEMKAKALHPDEHDAANMNGIAL